MTIVETKTPQIFGRLSNNATGIGRECFVYLINPVVCVWSGVPKYYSEQYCQEHNIDVEHAEYVGGSIVNMPGDLSICISTRGISDLAPRIVNYIVQWLEDKGLNLTRDANDILINGKKVISWTRAMTVSGYSQNVIHFSVGPMDLDLVKAICTKPMEKIPGSLLDYNITSFQILRQIIMSGILPIEEDN